MQDVERMRTREREPEPDEKMGYFEVTGRWKARHERSRSGTILIKGKDRPWEINPQGKVLWYAHPGLNTIGNIDWDVFRHEIRIHSGKHVHQGGLVLFITKGRGYTVCDGERVDWKAGDLLMLPIKPGGVEHQHFNIVDDEPSEWVAFIYEPWINALGNDFEQREVFDEYKEE